MACSATSSRASEVALGSMWKWTRAGALAAAAPLAPNATRLLAKAAAETRRDSLNSSTPDDSEPDYFR